MLFDRAHSFNSALANADQIFTDMAWRGLVFLQARGEQCHTKRLPKMQGLDVSIDPSNWKHYALVRQKSHFSSEAREECVSLH